MNIGICDDEKYHREALEQLVRRFTEEAEEIFTIHTYESAEELTEDILSNHKALHLLFLDVEMPRMSGLDASKQLREHGYEGIICFVTGRDQYALEAFSVDAIGYIRKPAEYHEVERKIKQAMVQIAHQREEQEAGKKYLEITTKNEKTMIDSHQILYVEKQRNRCVLHMEESEIVCYDTLKKLYDRLNQQNFCYVHQGYIVNFDKVKEVRKDTVCLGKGLEIPLSRQYQKKLKERHMNKIYRLRKEREDNQ